MKLSNNALDEFKAELMTKFGMQSYIEDCESVIQP